MVKIASTTTRAEPTILLFNVDAMVVRAASTDEQQRPLSIVVAPWVTDEQLASKLRELAELLG